MVDFLYGVGCAVEEVSCYWIHAMFSLVCLLGYVNVSKDEAEVV